MSIFLLYFVGSSQLEEINIAQYLGDDYKAYLIKTGRIKEADIDASKKSESNKGEVSSESAVTTENPTSMLELILTWGKEHPNHPNFSIWKTGLRSILDTMIFTFIFYISWHFWKKYMGEDIEQSNVNTAATNLEALQSSNELGGATKLADAEF